MNFWKIKLMLKPWRTNAHVKEFYTAWCTVKEDSYCFIGNLQTEVTSTIEK